MLARNQIEVRRLSTIAYYTVTPKNSHRPKKPVMHQFLTPFRFSLFTILVLTMTVCRSAETKLGGLEAEQKTSDPIRVTRNQQYCSRTDRSGLCDVYLPGTPAPPGGFPVVVVVHGGAWISGDKWTLEGYSRSLAKNGIAAVTTNYRLAPDHKFPAQVDDVREVLLWTQANADRLSLDRQRIGLFGYSAGGHLAALISALADEPMEVQIAASQWTKDDARWSQLPRVSAVCAGGPPCDFRVLPIDNTALGYFLGGSRREKPEVYVAASPTAHVSAKDPATLIIHGDQDLLVPIITSQQFHKTQLAAGVDSRLDVMPAQGHMETFLNPQTRELVVKFFQERLVAAAK
jgi:acetyl esterase/lipase